MSLTWPWALLGLAALPALVAAYRQLLRGQERRRAELARQGLVVPGPRRDRARQVAAVLLLASFTVLVVALSRPVAAVAEPRREGTVVLAFDVSTSMAATDVQPTRLEAAKAAARGFVDKQPPEVRVGVVAFGGGGVIAQQPTADKSQVLAAVNRLRPQGETAVGRGILTSLSAIAGRPVQTASDSETGATGETPLGYFSSAVVILLSDGENTSGPDPADPADLASTAGVKVYTVGLGSAAGTVLEVGGFSIATRLDEASLQDIAATTGGRYYAATDAASLAGVYDSIELGGVRRTVPHEVTSLVAAVAVMLLFGGAATSVLSRGRVL